MIITAKAVAKGAYNAVRANLPIAEILTEAIKAGGIALSQAEKKNGFVDAGAKALMVFLQVVELVWMEIMYHQYYYFLLDLKNL